MRHVQVGPTQKAFAKDKTELLIDKIGQISSRGQKNQKELLALFEQYREYCQRLTLENKLLKRQASLLSDQSDLLQAQMRAQGHRLEAMLRENADLRDKVVEKENIIRGNRPKIKPPIQAFFSKNKTLATESLSTEQETLLRTNGLHKKAWR